ncbi:MAG: MBL fold metallo-hydrolase [Akkermansia sp.]|nr:MBL fold metallo-hydrolase [Akkermansia sp.]
MLQFCVLGSGSGGNATLVRKGETVIMIDAGFSATRLREKIRAAGVELEALAAILVTHEHADHIKGIHQFIKKNPVRVYTSPHTSVLVKEKAPDVLCTIFECGSTFNIGGIEITPLRTSHDAAEAVCFRLNSELSCFGYMTDTGMTPPHVENHFRELDSVVIESNYDPDLLAATTKRPWPLKARIASEFGHLSNEQACEFLEKIAHRNLKNVVLAHLSSESNTPELATRFMRAKLDELSLTGTSLYCASQNESLPWISVR